jgi:hypothetical protein
MAVVLFHCEVVVGVVKAGDHTWAERAELLPPVLPEGKERLLEMPME